MKNLEQQFSKDLMITQSSKTVRDSIPVDLLIDIFSRVSARSVARFRCVSKFWESILDLFLTKSVARPRIVFAMEVNEELFLFSSPQPQNPDENSSLVATPYKAFPKCFPTDICIALNGLVFLQNKGRQAWESITLPILICNLVTGESITLPILKKVGCGDNHFGFDPINKQYKVMFINRPNIHLFLTLETGKHLWRPIKDPFMEADPRPIYAGRSSRDICINGVVYYRADFARYSSKIVCFDFRPERFGLINIERGMVHGRYLTLFNYKGKLGAHKHTTSCEGKEEIVLWVLEDAEKHKWSKRIYVLPLLGYEIVTNNKFIGMTGTGELVYSPYAKYPSIPFQIYYYNIERNTFTRFNIHGFEKFEHQHIFVDIFLDFIENMKFM